MRSARRLLPPALLIVALLFAWLGTDGSPVRRYSLDASAQGYVDDGLKRAFVTFATARALNAVLSLAQGTQVSVQPLGVGVQISLGQLLHPINEVVGQFAQLMLIASIAFGAMEILIRVGGHWTVTLALTIVAVWYLAHRSRGAASPAFLVKLLAVLLFVRFAIPAVAIGSDAIYRTFMAEDYTASQQAIELSAGQIGSEVPHQPGLQDPKKSRDCGPIPDWLCRKLAGGSGEAQKADPKADGGGVESGKGAALVDAPGRIEKLRNMAESIAEHIVRLMAVFVLQTMVLPLLLVWVLLRGMGVVLQRSRSR